MTNEFYASISVTDGGKPIEFYGESNSTLAKIMRGNQLVGIGQSLVIAWDDYLYTCGADMQAPVNEEELEDMWRKYDLHNELKNK